LLEEEGLAGCKALVPYGARPRLIHWSSPATALAPNDYPIDSIKRQAVERSKKRLARQEPHGRVDSTQVPDSAVVVGRFNADTEPNVRRDANTLRDPLQAICSLGEYLKLVLRCSSHHVKNSSNE
jgi:hypothetical protein